MAVGLYSGVSGLALGVGLYKGVNGLWGGASGLINGFGGSFSPASLFALGEPGAWYDPSDLTTMFQDTAGTTPVTAAGQTVGLLLDKSKGLVLGPEQLSVGFTVTQAGAPAATYNTATGQGSVSRVSSSVRSFVRFNLTSTSFYRLTIQNTGGGSLEVSALVGGGLVASGQTVTLFTSGASSPTIFATTDGTTVTFTVVSIKELPGNHATQATSAQRPTLGRNPVTGTRNLLTYTEQFDNAAWVKSNTTATANAATAPDGDTTADALFEAATTGFHSISAASTVVVVSSGQTYNASFYVKANGRTKGYVSVVPGGGFATFDIAAKTIVFGGNGTNETVTAQTITELLDGWFRLTITSTFSGAASVRPLLGIINDAGASSYTGDVTKGFFIWGAQLEVGSTATTYQRVVSAFDVTQAGVADAWYLSCDGTDDGMVTNTITPGIDKAQVFAGVRKLSDAARSTLVELSASTVTNNGAMHMTAPEAASATFAYMSKGTAQSTAVATSLAAPTTRVLTGLADISGDSVILRVNGTQAAADTTTDQGTGNFLPYPLYIGRRGGSSLPFNGRIYGLAVRFGANLTAAQITQMETWMNGKTGAY